MSTLATTEIGSPEGGAEIVPLHRVEAELDRLKATQVDARRPVHRARMSNLIVYCSQADLACRVEGQVPEIVAIHPARVLLLNIDPSSTSGDVEATVLVRQIDHDNRFVSEQVTLRAGGRAVETLPFAVRSLLIGDLPTNLWWACPTPPPLAGSILVGLAEHAQQVIFDSMGWADPNRGVASTSTWLDRFELGASSGRWRIASDLNWRRLKTWRRLLSQGLDPASAPGMLTSISDVLIEHGPHAVTQAWGLAGWLASRLGWSYQAGKIQDNVEIAFRFRAPHGPVSLRIDRLPEGPPEITRVRVSCGSEGKHGVLDFAAEVDGRLAVAPQGSEVAARTVAVPPQRIAELIGRQLSDREPDPVFRQSMRVAQQLAQHVVG
jgi:glucose-6-phosphate dehydrogenase assembly protein OpcA